MLDVDAVTKRQPFHLDKPTQTHTRAYTLTHSHSKGTILCTEYSAVSIVSGHTRLPSCVCVCMIDWIVLNTTVKVNVPVTFYYVFTRSRDHSILLSALLMPNVVRMTKQPLKSCERRLLANHADIKSVDQVRTSFLLHMGAETDKKQFHTACARWPIKVVDSCI